MWRWLLGATLLLVAPGVAECVSVAPVLLEVIAPAAATLLTLRNDQARPLNVQVRVYRWQQDGGQERLVPTQEVVVSPPFATMQPGSEQVGSRAAAEQGRACRRGKLPRPCGRATGYG